MSRSLRQWYPGATYHIMHRGIRRKEIFSNEEDYQMFLTYLKKEAERYGCLLHAYCLMTNHIHLLIETSNSEIWLLMKNLSHNYAQYYNSRHHYCGHLFESRYVSSLVKDDVYFLQTSRYIHLNPVKAHITRRPEEYAWSSFRAVAGLGADRLTEKRKTLSFFQSPAQLRYREFVLNGAYQFFIQDEKIHQIVEKDEVWLPW